MNTDEVLGEAMRSPDGLVYTLLLLTCVIIAKEFVKHIWDKIETPKDKKKIEGKSAEYPEEFIEMVAMIKDVWRQVDPTRNDNLSAKVDRMIEHCKEDNEH